MTDGAASAPRRPAPAAAPNLASPPRRVVTGLDAQGRSCFLIDGPAPGVIWTSDRSPADNGTQADAGGRPFTFAIPPGGTQIVFHDFAPRTLGQMHATDTLDYAVIVSGEVHFLTETGEVLLRAGDVLVDRGAYHAWRNDGDAPCRAILMHVKAEPVGRGATVGGEIMT